MKRKGFCKFEREAKHAKKVGIAMMKVGKEAVRR